MIPCKYEAELRSDHFIRRAVLASHVHLWHASATCCNRHIARGMKRVTTEKLLRGAGQKEVILTPESLLPPR